MALSSRCPWLPRLRDHLFVRGLLEQITYLLVGCLPEVLVPEANGKERLWPEDTHQFVHLVYKLLARGGCSNRDSNDDAGRLLPSHRGDSRTHGGPGRDAIIDEDDRTTVYLIGRAVPAVEAFAPLHFSLLVCCNSIDLLLRDTQLLLDVVIEHTHSTRGDGPHREFFFSGDTQLAYDDDIKRGM